MDTKRVASVALLFAISLVCSQGAAGLQPAAKRAQHIQQFVVKVSARPG